MNKNISLRMHTLSVAMMMALLIQLAISMSACGYATSTPSTNTGGSGGTNTPVASTPGLPGAGNGKSQNCGTLHISQMPQWNPPSNTKIAGNCLWQAYQLCRSASLVVNFTGIDTIIKRTFTVEPSKTSTCHVTDVSQLSVLSRPLKTLGSYSCASISNTQQALVIKACGKDGNITIPLR
jgi:hypothetical protein